MNSRKRSKKLQIITKTYRKVLWKGKKKSFKQSTVIGNKNKEITSLEIKCFDKKLKTIEKFQESLAKMEENRVKKQSNFAKKGRNLIDLR
jgi:hypothetical protein